MREPVRSGRLIYVDVLFGLLANALLLPAYAVVVTVGWFVARPWVELPVGIILGAVFVFWIAETALYYTWAWTTGQRRKSRDARDVATFLARIVASPVAAWAAGGLTTRAALWGLGVGIVWAVGSGGYTRLRRDPDEEAADARSRQVLGDAVRAVEEGDPRD